MASDDFRCLSWIKETLEELKAWIEPSKNRKMRLLRVKVTHSLSERPFSPVIILLICPYLPFCLVVSSPCKPWPASLRDKLNLNPTLTSGSATYLRCEALPRLKWGIQALIWLTEPRFRATEWWTCLHWINMCCFGDELQNSCCPHFNEWLVWSLCACVRGCGVQYQHPGLTLRSDTGM